MNEDLDKIEELEEKLKREELAERRKKEMPVSGRSVFQIQQVLNQKGGHQEKRK